MINFNKAYFLLAVFLLIIELYIGLYLHDKFIRPYGGDFLVVILLYCLVKSFVNAPVVITASCVLVFACLVEVSQYFHLINRLGLQNSKTAKLLLGTFFSLTDILAYALGILLVIIIEKIRITVKINFNT